MYCKAQKWIYIYRHHVLSSLIFLYEHLSAISFPHEFPDEIHKKTSHPRDPPCVPPEAALAPAGGSVPPSTCHPWPARPPSQ